jgi:hypothetical protein
MPEYVHLSVTVLKETNVALEKYCTGRHRGRVARITKSHVVDDAMRSYFGLETIERG